ncbi:hypothetical protein PSEUDO9AZ_20165 [Pseudomonas sp. 9AZ]|nr:hypothetical protein PSEUDO9AZ_20165 [Pseudomonas sp. 9AZ]
MQDALVQAEGEIQQAGHGRLGAMGVRRL